jgi:carbon monoxide dehydrogenase subunit G
MNFEGTSVLPGAPAAVWPVLLDVEQFSACMPGVEDVVQLDERSFTGTIRASVGPISGHFAFRSEIVDSDPARSLTVRVAGTDSVTHSDMTADVLLTLAPTGAAETEMGYRATIDVSGRLALLGDMVLRATAALMLEEFTKRLRARMAQAVEPA